jgi:hypothetical protein
MVNGMQVKRGKFLHNGRVVCDVRIVRAPVRYGSGDADDPPAKDEPGPWFYFEWGSAVRPGELETGKLGRATLAEAVAAIEKQVGSVTWMGDAGG